MTEVLTYEELKAERDALAVENQAVKAMNDCLSEELRGYESDGAFEGPNMHLLWWKSETPATSAALAAIQAQGVEKFVDMCREKSKTTTYPDDSGNWMTCAAHASGFATKLREAK